MKISRIYTIMALLLMSVSTLYAQDRLQIENFNIAPAKSRQINVELTNSASYTGFQAEIELPDNMSISTLDGEAEMLLTSRADDTHMIITNQLSEKLWRVVCFSMENVPFKGTEGDLMNIKISTTQQFAGGEIILKNIIFTNLQNQDVSFSNTTTTVGIQEQNNISVSPLQISESGEYEVTISLTNDTEFTAFQTEIILPEELSIIGDSFKLTSRATTSHSLSTQLFGNNKARVVVNSMSNAAINNCKGAIVTFKVLAQSGVVKEGEIVLQNNYFSDASANEFKLPNASAAVTISTSVKYNVSVSATEGGTAKASVSEVEEGEEVTLTAIPNEGFKFTNWTVNGEVVSAENPYTVTITADTEYVANFVPFCTVTVLTNNRNWGTVNIDGEEGVTEKNIVVNNLLTFNAVPAEGCGFVNWTVNGEVVSTENPFTTTITTSADYVANFKIIPTKLSISTVECSLKEWNSYTTDKMIDGSYSTYYDSLPKQEEGSTVTTTLDDVYILSEVKIYFRSTYYPTKAKIQVSTDGTEWKDVENGEFAGADVIDASSIQSGAKLITVNCNGVTAKYVRMLITEKASTYLTIYEFEVYGSPVNIAPRTISVSVNDETMGNVAASATEVEDGGEVTLTATANYGYKFVNWTVNGEVVSIENPYTAIVTANTEFVANFEGMEKSEIEVTKTDSSFDATVVIKTDAPATVKVGEKTYTTTVENNLTVEITIGTTSSKDVKIESVGGKITSIDCIDNTEVNTLPESVTEIILRDVEAKESVIDAPALSKITVVSDADNNVAKVSTTSNLSQGVQVVVEKEIYTPYYIEGVGTPTIFNFLSMPFAFNTSSIKYWDGDSWEAAALENQIRVLMYNSTKRANGSYSNTWEILKSDKDVAANQGFVVIGNNDLGATVKLQFTSAVAAYDGSVESVVAKPYRKDSGETSVNDADWNFNGVPYLTSGKFPGGYTLYSYKSDVNNRGWIAHTTAEGLPTLQPYNSVMYQANLGNALSREIEIIPSVANATNDAENVFARAYISIDDTNPAKIILSDESSENFVLNEDAWYMAPLNSTTAAAYFNVEGAEASVSVQPAASELPMTVYTGAGTQHRITLTATDGNYDVYLKDAVTNDVVCLNDEDYNFTATAKTTIANRFTVSMVEPTGIIEAARAEGTIKAVVTANGIKLVGTEEGYEVTLYNANGMIITNATAEDGVTTIATSATGVIIIKVADQTVKVVK